LKGVNFEHQIPSKVGINDVKEHLSSLETALKYTGSLNAWEHLHLDFFLGLLPLSN